MRVKNSGDTSVRQGLIPDEHAGRIRSDFIIILVLTFHGHRHIHDPTVACDPKVRNRGDPKVRNRGDPKVRNRGERGHSERGGGVMLRVSGVYLFVQETRSLS